MDHDECRRGQSQCQSQAADCRAAVEDSISEAAARGRGRGRCRWRPGRRCRWSGPGGGSWIKCRSCPWSAVRDRASVPGRPWGQAGRLRGGPMPAARTPIKLTRRGRVVVGVLIGLAVAAVAVAIWLAVAGQAQASSHVGPRVPARTRCRESWCGRGRRSGPSPPRPIPPPIRARSSPKSSTSTRSAARPSRSARSSWSRRARLARQLTWLARLPPRPDGGRAGPVTDTFGVG